MPRPKTFRTIETFYLTTITSSGRPTTNNRIRERIQELRGQLTSNFSKEQAMSVMTPDEFNDLSKKGFIRLARG